MPIRPVQPTDHTEWLRMRRTLWGGAVEEHPHDMDTYFATPQGGITLPQGGITFVVERTGGGLCGFIEVSLRSYAEGCQTSPVAYIEGWYVDAESHRHILGTPPCAGSRGMGEAAWAQGNCQRYADRQYREHPRTSSLRVRGRGKDCMFQKALDASGSLQAASSDASASTRPQRAAATHAPQP
jgi:hypothetical protein